MLGSPLYPTNEFIQSLQQKEIRHFLLLQTAGFNLLLEKIMVDYPQLENMNHDKRDIHIMVFKFSKSEGENIYSHLLKTSKELGMKYSFLKKSLCFYPYDEEGLRFILDTEGLPIYHASETTPITEEGVYIKTSPFMPKKELLTIFDTVKELEVAYEKIRLEYKEAIDHGLVSQIRKKHRDSSSGTEAINTYINIEAEMYDFAQVDYGAADMREESVVNAAIKLVADEDRENSLSAVSKRYYDIQNKYYIPSFSDFLTHL